MLKSINFRLNISIRVLHVFDSFLNDLFIRFATKAASVATESGDDCLTSKHIETALRLLLSRELAQQAIFKGAESLTTSGADLRFPIDYLRHLLMKDHYFKSVEDSAPIYLASALEYFIVKIAEFSCNEQSHRRYPCSVCYCSS